MSAPHFEPDDNSDPVDIVALQRELREKNENLERERAERARTESRLDSFLQGRQRPDEQREAPLGPPPNPLEYPEEHQKWLLERDRRQQAALDRRFEQSEALTRSTISEAQRAAQLWNSFVSRHPEHAKRSDLAKMAFESIKDRGVLSEGDDAVIAAVRSEMDRIVGFDIAAAGSAGDPNKRTDGLSGGTIPKLPSKQNSPPTDDGELSMHNTISNQQAKFGLI